MQKLIDSHSEKILILILLLVNVNPEALIDSNFNVVDYANSNVDNFSSHNSNNNGLLYTDYVEAHTEQKTLKLS